MSVVKWQSGDVTLYCGNCLDILPTLGKVDAVVTDPPYGVDVAEWDTNMPYRILEDCLYASSGPMVAFGSASNLVLDAKSFITAPERALIWSPKFTLSKIAKDGFAYRFHPIWLWKPRKQRVIPWDVLDDATECGNWWKHTCTKPLSLMERLAGAVSDEGATVLDPFMGSGTTGVACVRLGRKFIGIEIEPKYFEIAKARIRDAQKELALFEKPPTQQQQVLSLEGVA